MAKAVSIKHAFILKDGVMFKLGRGVLKANHDTKLKAFKPKVEKKKPGQEEKDSN